MQGRGVTNYAVDRPSYEYTTSTTEFDDELIKRGIVTVEQAMLGKGASPEQAVALANQKRKKDENNNTQHESMLLLSSSSMPAQKTANNDGDDDDQDDDYDELNTKKQQQCDKSDDVGYDSLDDDDDDDDTKMFMQKYRQERLKQMQAAYNSHSMNNNNSLIVEHMVRDDWRMKVNEASMNGTWIIVTLVESVGNRRDRVIEELHRFARQYDDASTSSSSAATSTTAISSNNGLRLLTIDALDAIPNWPSHRVPAMFAYRNGIKIHEWIASRQGEFPGRDMLGELFQQWGVPYL